MLLQFLSIAISLGSLVCYVLVVIQMFKHGKTGPAVGSLVGLLACGLGALFAFIYGWTKAGEWQIKNLMLAWTGLIVLNIGITVMTLPGAIQQVREESIRQQNAAKAKSAPVAP
jgi:hypothetical protein